MKLYVKAVGKDSKLKWPSYDYVSNYTEFNIECDICDEDLGISKDKYKLCLKGKKENIESFISYLRMKGFKVKF